MKNTGKILKEKREEKRLTVEQVNKKTRIPRHYVTALEEGDLSKFPADVYYTGSLRKYAAFLGLNAEEFIDTYQDSKLVSAKNERAAQIKKRARLTRLFLVTLEGIVLGIAVLGAGLWLALSVGTEQIARVPVVIKKVKPVVQLKKMEGVNLEVKAVNSTWLRIVSDNRIVFEGIMNGGKTSRWQAKDKILLRTGFANGIQAWVNGKEVDLRKDTKKDVTQVVFTPDQVPR